MQEIVLRRLSRERFEDLYLCYCGYEKCEPLHSWGPVVRPNYIIHYVLEGKGIYQVSDTVTEVRAGEGFLIEPGVQTFYQADAENPWTYLWVGFDGKKAKEILKELGMGEDRLVFHCKSSKELEETVLSMLKNNVYSLSNDLLLESKLYQFFSILFREMDVKLLPRQGENGYVTAAIQYIRKHYFDPIRINDIADYANVNRSYLYSVFQKELGISPSKYLSNFRLSRAAELLSGTEYSVESVANSCGYQDPLVFSKAFKRQYAMSPVRYRKLQGMVYQEKIENHKKKREQS